MDFKYLSSFSSVLKPVISQETDKYLALASLVEVGQFIPNIDTDKNMDILPVAFNAAVVNRVNKNGDVIDTSTALAYYKNFINKPINSEHNREKIVGFILVAGFSEFGTDKPLSEEQVKDLKGPFNIVLGGVIWRIANQALASKIEDCGDPSSKDYGAISASWELGFNDFELLTVDGESKNIEDGVVISDASIIETIKDNLKALGGSGKYNKKNIYRKVSGSVVPLGIGLTETPAAEVKGIATIKAPIEELKDNSSASVDLTSNLEKETVIPNIMKITSLKDLKDLKDEPLTECKASAISDLIEAELKTASEKFSAEKSAVESTLKTVEANLTSTKAECATLATQMAELKAQLEAAQAETRRVVASDLFNARMSAFDAEFELDAEARKVIAGEIKDLDESAFAAFQKKMAPFMKKKGAKPEPKDGTPADKTEDGKSCAKETVASVVEAVTDKSKTEKGNLPGTSTASETLHDKYKKAFDYDGFVVSK